MSQIDKSTFRATQQQNRKLKQELNHYKVMYEELKIMYKNLARKYSTKIQHEKRMPILINSRLKIEEQAEKQLLKRSRSESIDLLSDQISLNKVETFTKKLVESQPAIKSQSENQDLLQIEPVTNKSLEEPVEFFEQEQDEASIKLIESCFIIEKTGTMKIDDALKYSYPKSLFPKFKQLYQLINSYTFFGSSIYKIVDDQFDSRKNQINYGALFQDLFYVFEDNQISQQVPILLKKTHSVRKRYVHAIIKPQVIYIEGIAHQTEVVYGFTSPLPLRPIFFDLNRTILQEIKYQQLLNNNGQAFEREHQYKIIGEIMEKVSDFEVKDFPITGTLKTGICSIQMHFDSPQYLKEIDQQTLEHMVKRFDVLKVSKIMHYVLAQKAIVLVGKSRSILNEMFQVIRLALYPFNWLFPIVYSLSQQFYPYLQSPMPILAGCQEFLHPKLPKHDFLVVFLDDDRPESIVSQLKGYDKSIKYLRNSLKKFENKKAAVLRVFMRKLKEFIEKGAMEEELSQFHIDFMETQMVSFYKQRKSQKSIGNE